MIFGVKKLVSYLSQFFTLYPGDIISSGTPSGVGLGMKPPTFLRPGQTIRLGVEGLGRDGDGGDGLFFRERATTESKGEPLACS